MFEDELKNAGVAVFRITGAYKGVEYATVSQDAFRAAAVKSGMAIHYDLPDLQTNTQSGTIDREQYVTAWQGLVYLFEAQGE